MYYIQYKGYCGNCLIWWKVDGKGYTSDLNKAWLLTEEEIKTKKWREFDIPRKKKDVEQFIVKHVTQDMESVLGYI